MGLGEFMYDGEWCGKMILCLVSYTWYNRFTIDELTSIRGMTLYSRAPLLIRFITSLRQRIVINTSFPVPSPHQTKK